MRVARNGHWALALLPLVACAEPAPKPLRAAPCAARFCVAVGSDARGLVVTRDGVELLAIEGLSVGVEAGYDPFRSYDPVFPDAATSWRSLTTIALRETAADASSVTLDLAWEGGISGTMDLSAAQGGIDGVGASGGTAGGGRWRVDVHPDGVPDGSVVVAYRIDAGVDPREGFYGLGEWFDRPEHRGAVRAMQIELDASLESTYNEAHVPVPFLTGTRGWGLFVEDRHPMVFDVASSAADRVSVTVGTGSESPAGLRFHLYADDDPLDLPRHYYATTGAPGLPARWALGPWLWRDETTGEAEVRADMDTLRALDLATSGLWIDRPYASGVNTFDFAPDAYADAAGMIAHAHDLGLRMALWHTPYVNEDEASVLHAEALAGGFFPPTIPPIVFNGWGTPVDFSNPAAMAWWQDLIRRYTDLGIEGFKLDYGEDIVTGVNGARLRWAFEDGSDERTMHKRYAELYHQAYAETLPVDGGFLLVRAGTWGDQVHAPIVWPGDLDADLSRFGELRPGAVEGTTGSRGVGGLPSAVSAAMGLGPSGFPYFASDTGGYRHAPPDKETFVRWVEHAALTTVMQTGNSASPMPWDFTPENGWDTESLGIYRDYARLHLRLWPYLWSYVAQLGTDAPGGGRALVRPLGLVHPELGHPDDTYFLGDSLLVAPVVTAGARTRAVPLPPGPWADWFTGEIVEGGLTLTVDAPLGKLPLFLAEGGMVPLLRPDIDTLAPTRGGSGIESMADRPGPLSVRAFPAACGVATAAVGTGAARFVLHDGGVLSMSWDTAALTLTWTPGTEFFEDATFELVGCDSLPDEARVDGETAPASVAWSATERLLRVTVPAGSTATVR